MKTLYTVLLALALLGLICATCAAGQVQTIAQDQKVFAGTQAQAPAVQRDVGKQIITAGHGTGQILIGSVDDAIPKVEAGHGVYFIGKHIIAMTSGQRADKTTTPALQGLTKEEHPVYIVRLQGLTTDKTASASPPTGDLLVAVKIESGVHASTLTDQAHAGMTTSMGQRVSIHQATARSWLISGATPAKMACKFAVEKIATFGKTIEAQFVPAMAFQT